MNIKNIFIATALMLTVVSCINDDSTGSTHNTSKLSLTVPFEKTYTLNRLDTLKLSPTVTQSGEQLQVKYEWEVNYKRVSTDRELKYVCSEFGKFPCRLKVTNGDDLKYYEFGINVQYAYEQGLYILGQYKGRTIVSYLPDGVKDKSFSLDVLAPNNPDITFGAPRAISGIPATSLNKAPIMYVAAGNPSTTYEMHGNLMIAYSQVSANGNVSFLTTSPANQKEVQFVVVDGKPARYSNNYRRLFDDSESLITALGHPLKLANALAAWKRDDLVYIHGFVFFENTHGHLLGKSVENNKVPTEILPNTFTGDTLIGMGAVDKERNIAMITRNIASSKFYLYYVFPGYYYTKVEKRVPAVVKYKGEIPATAGISGSSIVRTTKGKSLVYYSSGNNIYAYNVLSNGNFPTTPSFSVGNSGEVIVDIYINNDDSKMYIATNAASGDLPGSIYCYDLNGRTMLWQQRNITGKITNMIYRN